VVEDGVTIFLTTQYPDEADRLADRIAVLDHGRIVAEGTAAELKRRTAGAHILLRFASPADLEAAASAISEGCWTDGIYPCGRRERSEPRRAYRRSHPRPAAHPRPLRRGPPVRARAGRRLPRLPAHHRSERPLRPDRTRPLD